MKAKHARATEIATGKRNPVERGAAGITASVAKVHADAMAKGMVRDRWGRLRYPADIPARDRVQHSAGAGVLGVLLEGC